MPIKCVLLDLDQTLASPSQGYKFQDLILEGYSKTLSRRFNVPVEKVVNVVVSVVMEAKASPTINTTLAEKMFYGFAKGLGVTIIDILDATDEYYFNEFPKLKEGYRRTSGAYETVNALFEKGYRVAIATDPLIRLFGVILRLKWIGLDKFPYCHLSSADTSHAAKPHPYFFKEIVEKCGCKVEESVMVGDLIDNDIVGAKKAGLKTILFVHDVNKDIIHKRLSFEEKPDFMIHKLPELLEILEKI